MQKFKIVASKSNKKYNLILSAASESDARERIHKEWYSILSIKPFEWNEVVGAKFTFHINSGGKVKKGVIVWEDIFKSYVKLRKDLWYDVVYLYPEGDEAYLDDEKKKRIVHDLEQGYKIKVLSKEPKVVKKPSTDAKETQDIDKSFYLKKELEQTHELIENVLTKLNPIITLQKDYWLSPEKIEKLKNIYNNIVKLKKTTNISKLKEIGELALIKIGDIELQSLEKEKTKASKTLLKETNVLLKKIGSWKQFRSKERDINYILTSFFSQFKKNVASSIGSWKESKEKIKGEVIDKESYSFLKTLLLLEKYKEKLKDNNKNLLQNIAIVALPFGKNIEKRDKILLKRKVIKQNITLLKAKKQGSIWSYTSIVKGYNKIFDLIWELLQSISRVLLYVVVFYSFFFVAYLTLIKFWYSFWDFSFNYQWILYFLIVLLLVILWTVSRGVIMFFINVVFLSFICIFSIVNF